MSVKAWCQENSINEKQFFYWKCRVREEISSFSSELPVAKQNTAFIPLKVLDSKTCTDKYFSPDMVLCIGSSRLELSNQTSPELLANILKVLGHVLMMQPVLIKYTLLADIPTFAAELMALQPLSKMNLNLIHFKTLYFSFAGEKQIA